MKRLTACVLVLSATALLLGIAVIGLLLPFDDSSKSVMRALGMLYESLWIVAALISALLVAHGSRITRIAGCLGLSVIVSWFGLFAFRGLPASWAETLYLMLFIGQLPVGLGLGLVGVFSGLRALGVGFGRSFKRQMVP